MAQVLEQKPGFGDLLGAGLNQGLSSGLQALAQQKLQQIQQAHQRQQLTSGLEALGLSPQQAQAYSMLPESALGPLLKQHQRVQQLSQIPGLFGSNQNQPGMQNELGGIDQLISGSSMQSGSNLSQNQQAPSPSAITQASIVDPALGNALRAQATAEETARSNKLKEEFRNKQLHQGENLAATKAAEEYEKEIFPAADLAQKSKNELQQASNLIENGDFSNPAFSEVLSRFGLLPESFKTTDTKKLEALQLSLLKQFRPVAGKDVSDSDMRNILRRIIGPNMTREQNRALIDLFQFGLDEPIIRKDIYNDIVKKYQDEGKAPPRQIRSLVDREYSKVMEQRFNDLKNQVPEYKEIKHNGQNVRVEEFNEVPDPKQYMGQTFIFDGVKKRSNGVDWVPVHEPRMR